MPQSPYPQADPYVPRRSGGGGTMVLALLVLAALGVGTVGAGFVVYQGLQAGTLQPAAETVTPTDLDEVLAQDDGDGDGDEAAEPVEAAKITAEPPEPEPAPKAAPKPPPAPPGNDVRTLVNRGWQQVGTDLNQAAGSFQKALEIRSGDAEANYGYGYVLLQQGNTSGAQPYLCRALDGANVETRRDVTSLLNQYKLTCS